MSKMEFVTLLEALVITSNQFNNYDRQAQFIKVKRQNKRFLRKINSR